MELPSCCLDLELNMGRIEYILVGVIRLTACLNMLRYLWYIRHLNSLLFVKFLIVQRLLTCNKNFMAFSGDISYLVPTAP